jgi:uncharacterized protein
MAQQGVSLEGNFALKELNRLTPMLVNDLGSGSAKLQFGIDEQGIRVLEGEIELEVSMVCQRCLEPVQKKVQATLNLGMVWAEEDAVNLPKAYDPWIVSEGHVTEGQTDLYDVMEDELLLSLPIVVYHDYDCVPASLLSSDTEESDNDSSENKANPFAVLESLKESLKESLEETTEKKDR